MSSTTKKPTPRRQKKTPPHATRARIIPRFPIAGIGASAGGLEAFTQLLKHLPADTGIGLVFIQHLDPDHTSALTQLLARVTSMPVYEARNNALVAPNCVYVIPPNMEMQIANGVLKLAARAQSQRPHHAIDLFLESLAEDQKEHAIGIILSGTAFDGTMGLEAIRGASGITMAQDSSAKYDSMPRSAISAGCVDLVLSPHEIANELARIARHPYITQPPSAPSTSELEDKDRNPDGEEAITDAASKSRSKSIRPDHATALKNILLLLHDRVGVDFTSYKLNTIERRIARRMVLRRCNTLTDYAAALRQDPGELQLLYADLLINVTSFFRNPDVFEKLKNTIIPHVLENIDERTLRVWVPACATGQEPYSWAMILFECLETIALDRSFQIFATDLSDAALNKGRIGFYTKSQMADVTPERVKRFFVEEPTGYRIIKKLRETIIFARQNALSDPPFSRMDFISCRNLMIYMPPASQEKALTAFHYALRPDRFLLLGLSESVGHLTNLFAAVDKSIKLYSKRTAPQSLLAVDRIHPMASTTKPDNLLLRTLPPLPPWSPDLSPKSEADRITFKHFTPPGVLVDENARIIQFRGSTSPYLIPPTQNADFDLLTMAADGLSAPLKLAIERAKKTQRTVRKYGIPMITSDRETRTANFEVIPLRNVKDPHYLIVFPKSLTSLAPPEPLIATAGDGASPDTPTRNPRYYSHKIASLERQLVEARDYIEALQAHTRLSSTQAQTVNEQAQSINEELQSLNEELETSKEELESTNEELITVNEEMVGRNSQLNELNADLMNLHMSINMPILVLGPDLEVRNFTPPAEPIFNIMLGDIGRPLSRLRHQLTNIDLETLISNSMESVRLHECEIRDKQGRWYLLRVRPYLSIEKTVKGAVVVLIDIDDIKRSAEEAIRARDYAEAILRAAHDPLVVLSGNFTVVSVNDAFYHIFKIPREQMEGQSFFNLSGGIWEDPKLRQLMEDVLPRNSFFNDLEIFREFPIIGPRTLRLTARPLDYTNGRPNLILLSIEDTTALLESMKALRASETRFRRLFDTAPDGILLVDPLSRKVVDANARSAELIGLSVESIMGKQLWELRIIKDEPSSHQSFRELQKYGTLKLNSELLVEGASHHVEVTASIYIENSEEIIQCNIREIDLREDTPTS